MVSALLILLISINSLRLHAVEIKPLRSIPFKLAFEISVSSPSLISVCGKSLWSFSESSQTIFEFDLKNGKLKSSFTMSQANLGNQNVDVAAITCQLNRLLVLVNSQPKGKILEFYTEQGFRLDKTYSVPLKGRATDLFCNLYQCWILQDKPMITYDLKKWTEVWAPFPPEMKKVYAHPDLNPFEDWQATLNLAKGRYIRGAIDNYSQFVLLDPFHAQAIIRTGAEWKKWGGYGAWEGSFLSPKAITFIAENTLAVADVKLKAIFIFRRDGTYIGLLANTNSQIFTPDYPMGLAINEGRLFVSDFRANKISALDLIHLNAQFEKIQILTVRQNLFRRQEVLNDSPSTLCLNCHDGTVSNQLHKFVNFKHHHPLECSQCHDPHHNSKNSGYLKETPSKLCQSCHIEYKDPKTNHLWSLSNKPGGSCMDCHRSHTNNPKLLINPTPGLCNNCHKDQVISHKSVTDMMDLQNSKDIFLSDGKINCLTCHQTHVNWKESHFIKNPESTMKFCASCHGGKSTFLYKDFHKIMHKKGNSK